MALGKVYCFGPTFRAEKSKTRRHLTEFWMVEPEMAYADLDDVIALAEGLVVEVVGRVLDKRKAELKVLERDTSKLEVGEGAVPADHVRRGGEDPARQGPAVRVRRRPRRHRRDRALRAVRSAGLRHALPGRGEGVLHEARSRAARQGARASTCSRPKATARSSAAASASTTTTCWCSASRSTTCRWKRSSGTSTCAATARCRTAASAWASSACVAWICGLEHVRETIPYPRMLYRLYP